MKVSVLWLGLFLVSAVLLWAAVQGYFVAEAFLNPDPAVPKETKEGFLGSNGLDINVSSCPANTVTYINEKGNTVCCEGKLVDGKCSGREVCSLSQGSGLPTCSEYRAAWLDSKGELKCPRRLANYFENEKGVGGCTSGPRNEQGTAALNGSDPQCMLYTDADTELKKKDSCLNQKHFEQSACFSRGGIDSSKDMFETGWGPAIILCSYRLPGSPFPQMCYPDNSLYRFFKFFTDRGQYTEWKNWFSGSNYTNKIYFCSKAQKVNIDKSITMDGLKSELI